MQSSNLPCYSSFLVVSKPCRASSITVTAMESNQSLNRAPGMGLLFDRIVMAKGAPDVAPGWIINALQAAR